MLSGMPPFNIHELLGVARESSVDFWEVARDALLRRIAGHHIDGNIRPTVRDCVNGLPDVQDIYDYCDEMVAEIDAALSDSEEQENRL